MADIERTSLIAGRDDVAAAWLAAFAQESTRKAYRFDLDLFFAWCDKHGVDALSAKKVDLDTYRNYLARRGYVDSTVHRKLASISSYYQHAVFEFPDLIQHNPLLRVRRPKVSTESTTASLDLDELQAVFAVADRHGGLLPALIRMLAYTGLRLSELERARVTDLHTERGSRTIAVKRKGGRAQRIVIAPPAYTALSLYLDGRKDGPLFIGVRRGPMSKTEIANALDRVVNEAGIEKRITPHSMRHTFTTLALDAGVDVREVQRMLGHAHLDTTMRYDRARSRVDRSPAHALAQAIEGVA